MQSESDDFVIHTRWTLIERLKNWEDQESWREFFDTYWKLIYGVAVKSGLRHDEAQDVVQATVMSVCKSIKSFRADPAAGSFKSWLLTLTRWRITDQIRRRTPGLAHKQGTGSDASTSTEERMPDPADELEQIWDQEWQKHLVNSALEIVQRESSALHYQVFFNLVMKQSPPAQVASACGVKVDQVYLIKHRLGAIFQRAIQELEAKLN